MFQNRKDAGLQLAEKLIHEHFDEPIVLALPRGGVPVAHELAKALNAPLDLLLVKKIGLPFNPELALGAVVEGQPPQLVINEDVRRMTKPPKDYIEQQKNRKLDEIKHLRELYLKDHDAPTLTGRDVIIVDDGVATGATVRAAIKGVKAQNPKRIILAVPVAPPDTIKALTPEVSKLICLESPRAFYAIGNHYEDFHQLHDQEVKDLLAHCNIN